MELRKINMDRIILSKNNEKYDDGEVFLLAKSIALAGLLSPITVVPLAHSDRYEIVSGNKRFYACRLLGFKEITAIIIKADPYFARTTLKKGENQDVFTEADSIKEVLTKTNLTVEELCNLTTYTTQDILSLLRLSSMSDLEREIVRNNDITNKIAAEIASHEDIRKRNALLSEATKKSEKIKDILHSNRKNKIQLKNRARRTPKFRDLRLFDNTVAKAIKVLKEAGIDAQVNTEKTAGYTEYKIVIHN